MFKRVLIANRGEIACRVIDTCRRLGIAAVAVYSDADAGARHVRMANEAAWIGPAEARRSYLDGERIIDAAKATGAEAVHPGYGFLAENADFARAVGEAGLIFIGPRPETIEAMGSKARARAIMREAGVPVIPGYDGAEQDDEILAGEAARIGFPLMLKAAAGGGGKGMRIVRDQREFPEALASTRREAEGAFGDASMIMERYLEQSRHIEAQIFGDAHGNVVHLFERDCSSQRRHQKVVEESPAPGLDPGLRRELLEAAVQAARAVDYLGAGTVEFMVAGKAFYFLEMNTRLQVEHPVTELVTGLDLVEWQLRIAAGERLPLAQDEIVIRGHAIEARIYAEDPARGFLPATGRITDLKLPAGSDVRVDTGVETGDVISVHYDPMIAKIVAHGVDRGEALARLQTTLAGSYAGGVTTNIGFLEALLSSRALQKGEVDTALLGRALDEILDEGGPPPRAVLAAAAAGFLHEQEQLSLRTAADPHSPWVSADGWRLGPVAPRSLELECSGRRFVLEATGTAETGYRLVMEDGHTCNLSRGDSAADGIVMELDGNPVEMHLHGRGDVREISHGGRRWRILRHTPFENVAGIGHADGRVVAPMPGKVLEIRVENGAEVGEGQALAVMEAMKMELTIHAPIGGTVEEIRVSEGEVIEADALIMTIA